MIPCSRISEFERDQMLLCSSNLNLDDAEQRQLSAELRAQAEALKGALSDSWLHGFGDKDFFVHTGDESDRMLCVEISNRGIIKSDFLRIAQSAVARISDGYCVDFCNAKEFLRDLSCAYYPDFNIFVSAEEILVYAEDDCVIQDFGLDKLIDSGKH
jgi:hypothetical protein